MDSKSYQIRSLHTFPVLCSFLEKYLVDFFFFVGCLYSFAARIMFNSYAPLIEIKLCLFIDVVSGLIPRCLKGRDV